MKTEVQPIRNLKLEDSIFLFYGIPLSSNSDKMSCRWKFSDQASCFASSLTWVGIFSSF